MIPPHLPKRMLPLMKLERVTKVRGKGHPLLCYLCPCYVRCLGCYAAKREPTSWASGLDSEQNSKKWVGYGQYIQQLASQCLKANINASASFFFYQWVVQLAGVELFRKEGNGMINTLCVSLKMYSTCCGLHRKACWHAADKANTFWFCLEQLC